MYIDNILVWMYNQIVTIYGSHKIFLYQWMVALKERSLGLCMELYQLKTFTAVAREKHLTRAAEKLCITQPAVSSQIKQLEEELGLVLFTRTPRGMELTESGKIILNKALGALEVCDDIKKTAANLRGKTIGELKLGINTPQSLLKIDNVARLLHQIFPEVRLHLMTKNSPAIIKAALEKQIDLGFIFGEPGESVKSIKLAELDVVIIGPKKLEKQANRMELKDLSRFHWIYPPDWCPFKKIADPFFEEQGLKITQYIVSEDEELMKDLAIEQESFTLVFRERAQQALEEGKVFIWPGHTFKVPLQIVFTEQKLKLESFKTILAGVLGLWNKKLE